MSLEDELIQQDKQAMTTEEWLEQWVASLSAADRKVWNAWLDDPRRPAAAMFRVARAHGYPRKLTSFKSYVRDHRDALG